MAVSGSALRGTQHKAEVRRLSFLLNAKALNQQPRLYSKGIFIHRVRQEEGGATRLMTHAPTLLNPAARRASTVHRRTVARIPRRRLHASRAIQGGSAPNDRAARSRQVLLPRRRYCWPGLLRSGSLDGGARSTRARTIRRGTLRTRDRENLVTSGHVGGSAFRAREEISGPAFPA